MVYEIIDGLLTALSVMDGRCCCFRGVMCFLVFAGFSLAISLVVAIWHVVCPSVLREGTNRP